jgi:uncharacterized protein YecE (DUF72 family)
MAVIGTAGWSIATAAADAFPAEGSALERYAARFKGVEINSSFHRPHRASTWARWGASVPQDFRFAVKMPKAISHQQKLVGCDALVDRFLAEAGGLGDKLAILLLQLPPRLAFDADVAAPFLRRLTGLASARIACEPRHPSWFEAGADALLADLGIARVAADPAIVPAAAVPGGWRGLAYWRLHGSPLVYRSAYGDARIRDYAAAIAVAETAGSKAWCMFDNTASSAATGDALMLDERLG